MSGFDEEAERERLREKYERDREKRTATQRMSELLLKGATMTNRHCDACGDPIFRHDGQEFCPTCRAEGEPEPAAGTGESTAAAGEGSAGADAATATPDDEAGGDAGDDAETEARTADDDRTASPAGAEPSAERRRRGTGTEPDRAPAPPRTADVGGEDAEGPPTAGDRPPAPRDDVAAARASLSRTLVGYARAAEEADDPRRARELLGAAREAAETLAALDRR
jgi:uncharacterized Zn finger protein (UPF0148 family)